MLQKKFFPDRNQVFFLVKRMFVFFRQLFLPHPIVSFEKGGVEIKRASFLPKKTYYHIKEKKDCIIRGKEEENIEERNMYNGAL